MDSEFACSALSIISNSSLPRKQWSDVFKPWEDEGSLNNAPASSLDDNLKVNDGVLPLSSVETGEGRPNSSNEIRTTPSKARSAKRKRKDAVEMGDKSSNISNRKRRNIIGRPRNDWTRSRSRKLVRLYLMTDLRVEEIVKVLQAKSFSPW